MLLELRAEFTFDAAHHLPNYPGKCANVHGHRWRLEVRVLGVPSVTTGMVLDFGDLKQIVCNSVIDKVDHTDLNLDLPDRKGFPFFCPTAENITAWVVRSLLPDLPTLCYVRLYESERDSVIWRRGNNENTGSE